MPLGCRVDLIQRDTARLIFTGRLKAPVLLALAANRGALEDLAGLESVTDGRLQAREQASPVSTMAQCSTSLPTCRRNRSKTSTSMALPVAL